jgi:large subunit ribosomal protein L19
MLVLDAGSARAAVQPRVAGSHTRSAAVRAAAPLAARSALARSLPVGGLVAAGRASPRRASAPGAAPAGPVARMHGLQKFIDAVEKDQMKKNLPELKIGMTVKVGVTVVEGNKTRVQPYQGLIIAMHKHALNSTITVRKTFQGVGVERVFPVHSPLITLEPVVSAGVPRVRARCGPAAMRWPAGWRGAPAGRSAPKRAPPCASKP